MKATEYKKLLLHSVSALAAKLIRVHNRAMGAHVPVDILDVRSILGTELVELLRERCGVKAAISLVQGFLPDQSFRVGIVGRNGRRLRPRADAPLHAVFRLITGLNSVGCSIGRSAGR